MSAIPEKYVTHVTVSKFFIPADDLVGQVDPASIVLEVDDGADGSPSTADGAGPEAAEPAGTTADTLSFFADAAPPGGRGDAASERRIPPPAKAATAEPHANGARPTRLPAAATATNGHAAASGTRAPGSGTAGRANGISGAGAGAASATSKAAAGAGEPGANLLAGVTGAGAGSGGADSPLNDLDVESSGEQRRHRSDALKALGNEAFRMRNFARAVELYTEAIGAYPTAVLYSNRAMAHLKSESFGLAEVDASQAIDLDPRYTKAYHRRGSARLAQGRAEGAVADFRRVVQMRPKDEEAKRKLKESEEAAARVAYNHEGETAAARIAASLPSMTVGTTYTGPHLGVAVTTEFVLDLMEHFKHQGRLPKKYACQILLQVKAMLREAPSLVRIDVPEGTHISVCGDTHGQYYDLLNIFKVNGNPSETNPYLFNGDFVDRGSFSVENILVLLCWKLLYPNHFFLARGNHETVNMAQVYGFEGEVQAKLDDSTMELFTETFNWLPLAHVIGGKVLVVHGGLFSRDGVTLEDIEAVDRNRQPPDEGIMSDLLWSDPQPFPGRGISKRGVGVAFGPDVTKKFLMDNGLELLIRSHEVKAEGYLVEHDGRCITVFSAPNYCDQMGNKGALVKLGSDLKPEFITFEAVPHPPIRPMAYARSLFSSMFGM